MTGARRSPAIIIPNSILEPLLEARPELHWLGLARSVAAYPLPGGTTTYRITGMTVTTLRITYLRLRTALCLAPAVLSVFIGACSEGTRGVSATPAMDSPAELRNNAEILEFSIREGRIYNRFFRQGPVSAHMVLTSGRQPRLIVAFPAGNSGVSLWFSPVASDVYWSEVAGVRGVRQKNRDGEPLYGIETEITVDAAQLTVDQAVLSNVRVIRNYLHSREIPEAIETEVSVEGRTASWYRDRLDGHGGYELTVEVLEGSLAGGRYTPVTFTAPADEPLRLRVVALSGDQPLTPIETGDLLTDEAAEDPLAKNVLAFLSYREKLLAGSWRFCTYFGRDTLMSVRLLMPVLTTTTIEAGIGSVLARLNAGGEVAHEEDIGEFAVLRHGVAGAAVSDEPLFDYRMVDDDFMLAPIVAHYFLDHAEGKRRAAAFLQQRTVHGRTHGEALVSNLRFVVASAGPFASEPNAGNLIKLKEGEAAGQWRDSGEGLGYGRIPYDVNAVFVPAALTAIARLHDSGLLADYTSSADGFAQAASLADVWSTRAAPLFAVTVSYEQARRRIADYSALMNIPDGKALEPLSAGSADDRVALSFHALALDAQGRAIPILNSDEGFAMLFATPPAAELERAAMALTRPFPAGLLTPVGLLVANPVYASDELRRLFTGNHYHGTVVWSWHQALLAAGLERQLRRDDLPAATRRQLMEAQTRLWEVISSTNAVRNSELWTWSFENGDYHLEPYGQRSGDETESNAAQLWSTVYLAVSPPATTIARD